MLTRTHCMWKHCERTNHNTLETTPASSEHQQTTSRSFDVQTLLLSQHLRELRWFSHKIDWSVSCGHRLTAKMNDSCKTFTETFNEFSSDKLCLSNLNVCRMMRIETLTLLTTIQVMMLTWTGHKTRACNSRHALRKQAPLWPMTSTVSGTNALSACMSTQS